MGNPVVFYDRTDNKPTIFYNRTEHFEGNFQENTTSTIILTMNLGKLFRLEPPPGTYTLTYFGQSFTSPVTQIIVSAEFLGLKVGSGIDTKTHLFTHSSWTQGYGKDSIGYGSATSPTTYPTSLKNSLPVSAGDLVVGDYGWITYDFNYSPTYTMTANIPYVIALTYSIGDEDNLTESDYVAIRDSAKVIDGDQLDGNYSYFAKPIQFGPVAVWYATSAVDFYLKLSGDLTEISLNRPVIFYSEP